MLLKFPPSLFFLEKLTAKRMHLALLFYNDKYIHTRDLLLKSKPIFLTRNISKIPICTLPPNNSSPSEAYQDAKNIFPYCFMDIKRFRHAVEFLRHSSFLQSYVSRCLRLSDSGFLTIDTPLVNSPNNLNNP